MGIDTGASSPDDHGASPSKPTTGQDNERSVYLKRVLTAIERAIFSMVAVAVSILVPEFSSMMAFLGSFSAFMLCVIGPVSAKVALDNWKIGAFDVMLLTVGLIMAVWGTSAAFLVKS